MVDEPGDTTPTERGRQPESDGMDASRAAEIVAAGVARWRRRGYRVSYQDDFLAQMVSRGAPDVVALTLGLAALVAVAALWYERRSWLIVSITVAPDGRLVVHRQRSRRPPPE